MTRSRAAQIIQPLRDTAFFVSQGVRVDLSDLKDILRMLEEQEITEFELEQDGVKLRIARSAGGQMVPAPAVSVPQAPPVAAPPVRKPKPWWCWRSASIPSMSPSYSDEK